MNLILDFLEFRPKTPLDFLDFRRRENRSNELEKLKDKTLLRESREFRRRHNRDKSYWKRRQNKEENSKNKEKRSSDRAERESDKLKKRLEPNRLKLIDRLSSFKLRESPE